MHNVARVASQLNLCGPVLIGGSTALAHAGWTTQLDRMPEVICGAAPGQGAPNMRLRPRPAHVLKLLEDWTTDHSYDGCRVLRPEMAIADAVLDRLNGGATYIYDPDDLDPDEIDVGAGQVFRQALDALGASLQAKSAALELYGAILDERDCSIHFGR